MAINNLKTVADATAEMFYILSRFMGDYRRGMDW
jgi:hypothetical protein